MSGSALPMEEGTPGQATGRDANHRRGQMKGAGCHDDIGAPRPTGENEEQLTYHRRCQAPSDQDPTSPRIFHLCSVPPSHTAYISAVHAHSWQQMALLAAGLTLELVAYRLMDRSLQSKEEHALAWNVTRKDKAQAAARGRMSKGLKW